MAKIITVIVKEVGKNPYIKDINADTMDEAQQIVGGYARPISTHMVTSSPNQVINILADEEGRLTGKAHNFNVPGIMGGIVGTAIIMKASKLTGKWMTLSKMDIRTLCRKFDWKLQEEVPQEEQEDEDLDGLGTVLYVPQGRMRKVMTFNDPMDAINFIRGDEHSTFETMLIDSMPGIGIIAVDQDETTEGHNRLGIKGHFIILGLQRIAPDTAENPHIFRGLTPEELSSVKYSLSMTTMRNMMEEGEVEV